MCFGIALLYATAYTSGNMLDNLSILILLGFTTGYLLYDLKKHKKVVDEFLKDGIITDVLKYTHSCICTNTAGGEVR